MHARALRAALAHPVGAEAYPSKLKTDGMVVRRLHSLLDAIEEANMREGRVMSKFKKERLRVSLLL